jgi:hypothetical protein
MLSYWLRNYETWRDQVDELVVCINGNQTPEVLDYDQRIVERAGGRAMIFPQSIGHDGAMLWLLQNISAEYIVMCEDDAYVRHPEAVGQAFVKIKTGQTDIVGSPRHEDYATSPRQEWGPYTPGDLAELRHGLWPAFLFIRREEPLATDRVFGDRGWPRGGHIAGWGSVTPEACAFVGIAAEYLHLDTFFGTTFQLRAKGLRTELVHNVRVYDAQATEDWVALDPPWFHVTNLSTINYVLDGTPIDQIPDCGPGGGLWTRRVAWWTRTWKEADFGSPGWEERGRVLIEFMQRAEMVNRSVRAWGERFDPWVTWNERAAVPA